MGRGDVLRVGSLWHRKAAQAINDLNLDWGIYAPTLFATTNLSAASAFAHQWMRVGNTVTVSGAVNVDPVAAGTLTELGISLPVASDFAGVTDCGGSGLPNGSAGQTNGAAIYADTTNNRALLSFYAVSVANHTLHTHFTYHIM